MGVILFEKLLFLMVCTCEETHSNFLQDVFSKLICGNHSKSQPFQSRYSNMEKSPLDFFRKDVIVISILIY